MSARISAKKLVGILLTFPSRIVIENFLEAFLVKLLEGLVRRRQDGQGVRHTAQLLDIAGLFQGIGQQTEPAVLYTKEDIQRSFYRYGGYLE